ncbi:MAG: translocation/assembly module TamB domain-containing protein [Bacteroidetes bacterium]|nr:translocation/assembly module TamB domain-containing protein [Bacteroidota bacterium]
MIAQQAVKMLSEKLHTKVSLKHVSISFANRIYLQGLYVEDQQGDTLLYAGEAELKTSDWFYLKKEKPVLSYFGLHDAYVHLIRRADRDVWNYQFIADAFSSKTPDTSHKQRDFDIDLKHLDLRNVRFHSDDAWSGSDMGFDVGSLSLDAHALDLKHRILNLEEIEIAQTRIVMRDYQGGKPHPTGPLPKAIVDTTAFNPDAWVIHLDKLALEDCGFRYTSSDKPAPAKIFDETHLGISRVDLVAEQLNVRGDTLRATVRKLRAKERCGLEVQAMSGLVTVSPNVAKVDKLLLKTEHSTLRRSFAMHYRRFPDFLDYIDKVRMTGELDDASVSPQDIAYFAPLFKEYFPSMMKLGGSFNGTVADFRVRNLRYGDAGMVLTGDVAMKGLPDIYKTHISFLNGSVATSGEALYRFAPMLRNNPGFDLSQMRQILYRGSFQGYIDNFAAEGVLHTNLGSIYAHSRLEMPQFETSRAVYSSELTADNFYLGPLLRQPALGAISFKGSLSGKSFDAGRANLRVNGFISKLGLLGYDYQNISADGLLAGGKSFNGSILIDDPNLAMSFDGSADLSGKEPIIKAVAHVLQSNLQALHLTNDPFSFSADFDVDAQGDSIDDFLGKALLNNIDVRRAGHRLDIDSIFLESSLSAAGKKLLIESNDFTGQIEGSFLLSQLPYSVQYFVGQYLPSYFPPPKHRVANQDFQFSASTKTIDSLLMVLAPRVKGFDNTVVSGSLNTGQQALKLHAQVPFGAIGNTKISGLVLNGDGDYNRMNLSGDVASIMVGDTLLRMSLTLGTTVANDSALFNITSSSPDAYGTATLNGRAVARGDSIVVSLDPSEFFLNQQRWEIDGGAAAAIYDHKLLLHGLKLHSGLQQIEAASKNDQLIAIQITNLDLAPLASLGPVGKFSPEGRLNGTISLREPTGALALNASLRASNLLLSGDTIGEVVLDGGYESSSQMLHLNEGSGIFLGDASLNAQGHISLDSTNAQQLDGLVALHQAPLSWLGPLLTGYVSQLGGHANGRLVLSGTGTEPRLEGNIGLDEAAFRVDYLGTKYTIPKASIGVSRTKIVFDEIPVLDVNGNHAELNGDISHEGFRNFRLGLTMKSDEFEVLNLQDYENSLFYGHLVANVKSLTVRGPLNDIRMNIYASPADLSHIYLPIASTSDIGKYSYITFKNYGEEQAPSTEPESKLSINIDADLNPLAEITLILDPSTGDAINARGNGHLRMEAPSSGDLRMYGNFQIDDGDYTFTFRQLFFKRQFSLNSGSSIHFSGPIAQTTMDVQASYRTRASLYDLLTDAEKNSSFIPASEMSDIKRQQDVDVLLTMRGNMLHPDISFKLALPEKRSVGTYAYSKFERLNANERDLFNQVASLLLIGYFIPPEGIAGSNAATGAINNLSEVLSTNFSAQLTNIVNKLLGDPKLSVDFKYKNYNVSDGSSQPGTVSTLNRNEAKLGIRKNLMNDRVIVEVGSSYDWGRPVGSASSSSNFNLLNDFRIQLLLSKDGRLRLNGFRTTDYDVLSAINNGNITRSGIGISWRKTFNSLPEFFQSSKAYARKQRAIQLEQTAADSSGNKSTGGSD